MPLYGSTRQEVGMASFLLSDEILRTSFSKSFTERSLDMRSTSLSPAYIQRGFLRACRGCTLILRKYAIIWIPDSSWPRVFWSSWMRFISAPVTDFSSSVASASQERRRRIFSPPLKGAMLYSSESGHSSRTYNHLLRHPWMESGNLTSKYSTSGRTQITTPPML